MKRKLFRRFLPVLAALCLLLSGCQMTSKPAETTIFAMDTVMSLTVFGEDAQENLNHAVERIYQLERDLSATDPDSPVSALNRSGGQWTDIGEEGAELLAASLYLSRTTGGAMDLTAFPAVQAWGFTTGDYRVPGADELEQLAEKIDYSAVELDRSNHLARLPAGMELDFGAVAKGTTGDKLYNMLCDAGVEHALLDLGQSTITAIGSKPDGSPWRIGLRDPEADTYLGVVELDDLSMGTSGGYQRFFEQDGVTYWHIMDPETAAPARSGLASVTIVGPSALVCDGLSTALFVMGQERGLEFWRDNPELDFDVIFIGEDGSISLTAGLADNFTLAQGYEDREVTVLS